VRHLAARLLRIAEGPVTEHGGRIVKSIGDAVMFTAPTAVAASLAATEICTAVGADEDLPDVRAGIGHGPVLPGYADYFGRTVNLASRLCEAANPGEVLVHVEDESVPDAAWEEAGLTVKPRKLRKLKGIEGNVRVLAVAPTG
jgi:adenylate cyclase